MTHLRLTAFAAMAFLFYGFGIASSPAASPAGRYCGEVISNGDYQDITTILNVDRDGRISGTYQIEAPDGLVMGTLVEKNLTAETVRTMVWTDKYGSGLLTLHFSNDYRSFNGRWGRTEGGRDDTPSHSWNGAPCYYLDDNRN
ncbi:hypothetical protein [Phyllobacterium myrsinacearum]|uniref:Uncharacterized protein n=1 Tax=Phyllobacterium myrsinacearum TaxID=28101 RepID=A0A839E9B6_9HYPH|nr:hypothetical protein [Phyllobacterium myrsinacearum]MBA8876413.1 hypothetical protein [Phyllobacterium myrsinacearum]